jgi:hypothetical protein
VTRTLRAVPTSGVAALAERVLNDVDALAARMGEAYRREIAEYAAMSDGEMATVVLPTSRRLVTTFLDCVVHQRPLTERELRVFEDSGRERLRLGLPLESVLHAFRVGGREAWTALCAAVPPGEELLLADLGARWIDVVDRTSSAMARAYLAASHDRLRDLDARRRELVEALLTATTPGEVAAVSLRFSTLLAPCYVPVLLAGTGVAAGIDGLLAAAPTGTLGGHRGERVLLLVPHRLAAPPSSDGVLAAWGRPAACGVELLEEVRSVEQLLVTALAEGRTEGGFGPDDLLVEQLLLGNERVADALRRRVADVLAARDPGGSIVGTLRVYLASGSIPETGRREHVHANTVAYRLGRVKELTGLDPRVPRESALLVLGLGLPKEVLA